MSSLVRLDKVEGVKNEVHRGVLVALRDTDLSVKEIADSLGIASYSVYDIAHQYLPRGFMMARRKQLKRSSPDDLVHIVPPQSSNRPTVGGARAPWECVTRQILFTVCVQTCCNWEEQGFRVISG